MKNNVLWFKQPAENELQGLPVGNGHLGGISLGGVYNERIILNEDTLWSGFPRHTDVDNAAERYLPELRRLILKENDYYRSEELADKMQGSYNESYLPLGNLLIDMDHRGTAVGYVRKLDLEKGISQVSYEIDGDKYLREFFCSVPDQVMVLRLSSDSPGKISFSGRFTSFIRHATSGFATRYAMKGRCPRHCAPNYMELPSGELESVDKLEDHPIVYDEMWEQKKGMRFEGHLQIIADSGVVRSSSEGFSVKGSKEVVLLIWAGTSYRGFDKDPSDYDVDIEGNAGNLFNKASAKTYKELLDRHVKEHSEIYSRVSLDIKTTQESTDLPTDERRKRFLKYGDDPGMAVLFFNYGRYLLMGSSRPGTQPANLQGIWNWDMRPAWSCNYTLNINAQMIYWPAEVCNLSDLHMPFLEFIRDMTKTGAKTARMTYGCRGWVAHHNVDIWRATSPIGRGHSDSRWALWPMGGAWVCQHLWEHYLFTEDKEFLEEHGYPVLKDAARFILDFLVEDDNKVLVTCPSTVPENRYKLTDGRSFSVGAGSTLDYEIITDLFNCVKQAAEILDSDADLCAEIDSALSRFPNIFPLNKKGLIQEWQFETPYGFSINLLYGLYPGRLISTRRTPELARAAKKTLETFNTKHLCFPPAWLAAYWARLGEGEKAWEQLQYLIGPVTFDNLLGRNTPDIYQMDVNSGGTAAIAEMLLQSHDGAIELLPAVPKAWETGEVKGLKARGNFLVDIIWEDGKLVEAAIYSMRNANCKILYSSNQTYLQAERGLRYVLNNKLQISRIKC